jgi:hypothetical protein
VHEQVALVAAEGFVTAVSGDYHGHVLAAHPGHVEGGMADASAKGSSKCQARVGRMSLADDVTANS